MMSTATSRGIFDEMREHAYWKEQRDDIVKRAIGKGVSLTMIANTMGLDKKTVFRIARKMKEVPSHREYS
jgi:DNA-binding NarL/FixJ family response regulator